MNIKEFRARMKRDHPVTLSIYDQLAHVLTSILVVIILVKWFGAPMYQSAVGTMALWGLWELQQWPSKDLWIDLTFQSNGIWIAVLWLLLQ